MYLESLHTSWSASETANMPLEELPCHLNSKDNPTKPHTVQTPENPTMNGTADY
jgi:hypothetical protein